jgi:hypothetical protein
MDGGAKNEGRRKNRYTPSIFRPSVSYPFILTPLHRLPDEEQTVGAGMRLAY